MPDEDDLRLGAAFADESQDIVAAGLDGELICGYLPGLTVATKIHEEALHVRVMITQVVRLHEVAVSGKGEAMNEDDCQVCVCRTDFLVHKLEPVAVDCPLVGDADKSRALGVGELLRLLFLPLDQALP